MTILLILAAQAAAGDSPALDPRPFDLAADGMRPSLSSRRSCMPSPDGETVVVCGKRQDFRLPLPVDRRADPDTRGPGEPSSGIAALTPATRCGIFTGERSCGKAEAARYGYGRGRDPLSVLLRLGARVIDPDAELEPPPGRPR